MAEKLTALDVVKSRLEAASLGEFILPLQAGRGTREKIYESLEERLALGRGSSRVREDFQSRQSSLDSRRSILQGYLDAIASQFGATRMTVYQVIGLGIATAEIRVGVPKEVRRIRLVGVENFSPETNEALVRDAESFAERLGQIHRMPKLWLASNAAVLSRDDAEDAGDAAGQIGQDMHCFSEDFTASGLAPFLTSDPLSVDLGEIKKLLTALTLEAVRMDPALVDSLSNVEHRRHVQTLCGQIQERRTIHARLARILRDPLGWNVGQRIDAARDFAARNGGQILPEKHRTRVAELGKDISGTNTLIVRARALPASWTDRAGVTLRAICDNAAKLMAFPKSIRAIRRADEIPAGVIACRGNLRHGALARGRAGPDSPIPATSRQPRSGADAERSADDCEFRGVSIPLQRIQERPQHLSQYPRRQRTGRSQDHGAASQNLCRLALQASGLRVRSAGSTQSSAICSRAL